MVQAYVNGAVLSVKIVGKVRTFPTVSPGGGALIVHSPAGPYLVAASCTVILVRSVLTAWILMFESRQAAPGSEFREGT